MDSISPELENALVVAMRKAMTLEGQEEETQQEWLANQPVPPSEHLQVNLHPFTNSHANSIRVVLDDYMVETIMYEGSNTLGDQDQYALTPSKQSLQLTFNELMGNTWIEFYITNGPFKKPVSIWLRTDYIYLCDQASFPLDIELVDRDYQYVVRSCVLREGEMYFFRNLGIQTIK